MKVETSLKRFLITTLFILSCGAYVRAQSDPPPLEIGGVTFSGSIRERYEVWDWFPAKGQDFYSYSGTLMRFALSQKRQNFDWTVEFAVPVLLGLPDRAVDPAPQGQLGLGPAYYAANNKNQYTAFIFPKQAFVRLKGDHASLQFGRFEFTDGSEVKPVNATLASVKNDRIAQRLIGTFGYSDVMRSFDGAHYVYASGPWNFTAVGAIPTRGVFQVDGWGWVNTPIAYVSVTRELDKGDVHAEWRAFGLFYHDDRGVLKTDNRPTPVRSLDLQPIDIGTYGGHFIAALPVAAGTVDLVGWGALQTGRWGALTQRSAAGSTEAGFQPHILPSVRPWIRGGYFYSSGDGNPADDTHGTFFAVLPTPRVYARFPFFNEMNNRDLFAELMLRPGKNLVLRTDVHGLWLANSHDLWYTGGGAYQPWTFGFSGRPSNGSTAFANLYDMSADYKFTHGVTLGLYFGYAQGRAVIEKIYPGNSNSMLGFTEVNYRF